jgi:hypothetical protein
MQILYRITIYQELVTVGTPARGESGHSQLSKRGVYTQNRLVMSVGMLGQLSDFLCKIDQFFAAGLLHGRQL